MKKFFEKTIFTMISVIMVVMVGSIFTSCDNDDEYPMPSQISKVNQSFDRDSVAPTTRAANSSYKISESILSYFVHYCQRNAGPVKPGYPNAEGLVSLSVSQGLCCPDSYMMAAACLAHYKDGYATSYNTTGSKLVGIINAISGKTYQYLYVMANYANNRDASFLVAAKSGDKPGDETIQYSRSKIKTFMENALANNKFVIVNVNAKIYNYNTVNNSSLYLNNSSNPDLGSSPSYISTNNEGSTVGGHVILIIGIETNHTGDGVVTYIDPLAITRSNGLSNRRYVKYSTLLNSMKISGSDDDAYDAISVGLRY